MKLFKALALVAILLFSPLSFASASVKNCYLMEEVTNESVNPIIEQLQDLTPGQVMYLHIDSPGGIVDSGIRLIDAMHASKGTVITVLDGEIASMAVDIALAGQDVQLGKDYGYTAAGDVFNQDHTVMIHAMYIMAGLFPVRSDSIDGMKEGHKLQMQHYKGILTPAEQKQVFVDHEDLYMSPVTFVNRIHHHIS